jgi:hypothetical protein
VVLILEVRLKWWMVDYTNNSVFSWVHRGAIIIVLSLSLVFSLALLAGHIDPDRVHKYSVSGLFLFGPNGDA